MEATPDNCYVQFLSYIYREAPSSYGMEQKQTKTSIFQHIPPGPKLFSLHNTDTMSKLLTVFGTTGLQGGSIVQHVLNDPDLSQQFSIRGITRDATSSPSKALQALGVSIVEADASDASSLTAALQGTHTVFIVTSTIFDSEAKARTGTRQSHGRCSRCRWCPIPNL